MVTGVNAGRRRAQALLFDKDGTLFDFHATWRVWAGCVLADLAGDDTALHDRICAVLDFDPVAGRFRPASPVIAETGRTVAERLVATLPGRDVDALEACLDTAAAATPPVPAVPLAPLLARLAARGLVLGVGTNDTERCARAHLRAAGIAAHFHFVAGSDSGHGAKPDPGPLLAFAARAGLAPDRVAMIGDSRHDMTAARAAGMQRIAVLTGPASRTDLAPHADTVLPDIGHLPAWLEG